MTWPEYNVAYKNIIWYKPDKKYRMGNKYCDIYNSCNNNCISINIIYYM